MNMHATALISLIRRRGSVTPAEARAHLDVSAPTLSRVVAALGERVLALGSTNQRRYALPRALRQWGYSFPVTRISMLGEAQLLGRLMALQGDGYWFEDLDCGISRYYPGLPYFIDDMRPSGFLGRSLCKRESANLNLPAHLNDWTHEHALLSLILRGDDCVGNLVIGEESLLRYWSRRNSRSECENIHRARVGYPLLARAAIEGAPAGSSAAGEWPKFTTAWRNGEDIRHVIVKFSAKTDDMLGRRQADLLVAEHLALCCLGRAGYRVAKSAVIALDDRIFLEVERFDRVGEHGRRGVISLQAFDGEFYGELDNWANMADRLERDGYLVAEDAHAMRLFEAFGRLIANSDRHFGEGQHGEASRSEAEAGRPRGSQALAGWLAIWRA
jgi:hypothetical protein